MGTYYGMPMHMHSCWERNASMEGHMYQLKKLGLKYIYITDHDVRMGRRKYPVEQFDFSKGKLYINESEERSHGFKETFGNVKITEQNELCISAKSDSSEWTESWARFDSSQKRHELALLSNLILHLGMRMSELDDDMRVIVDVELSMRPPEFNNGHILYVFGNCESLGDVYHEVKPMTISGDKYSLSLLEDAQNIGGGDNVFKTLTFSVACRNGKSAELFVNHFSTSWQYSFEEGRQKQIELANELGKKYGITPFVTSEISYAGRHKNCFSTKVPILDYESLGFDISEEYAINHILSYGGIFSVNHPFEPYKGVMQEHPERKNDIYKEVLEYYLSNRGLGASLIEIGFPMGRSGFAFEDHLSLWDKLTSDGIFLTAYGDSDTHGKLGFFDRNNFVGYIYADTPCEEEFIHSMKSGNLYTGDPVYLENITISLIGSKNRPMGSVVFTNKSEYAILEITGINEEMSLVWNVNGKNLKPQKVIGNYCGKIEIPSKEKVNYAYATLYLHDRCIMITNPIHTTNDMKIFDSTPKERKISE